LDIAFCKIAETYPDAGKITLIMDNLSTHPSRLKLCTNELVPERRKFGHCEVQKGLGLKTGSTRRSTAKLLMKSLIRHITVEITGLIQNLFLL
jgi:hypothetical protein